jgi:hypothetical protein
MNRSFHCCIGILSLLGPLALASPALAQDVAAAEALFNRGLKDMEAGSYATGCPAIAESQRLDPRPGTLFTLSQCEVRWGRTATAVTRLGDYLDLYERLTPDQKVRQGDRRKVAKEQRDKLALEVPELTLSLPPGAPAGTVVKRDGAVVAGAALGVALPVDPGEHVVSTQAPGGALWEQSITIAKGEKKPLMLEVKAAPTVEPRTAAVAPVVVAPSAPAKQAEPPPPPAESGPSGRRVAVYALGGVGVAGLVLGGVMGGLALGKKSILQENCGSAIKAPTEFECNQTGVDAGTSVKTLGLVSTIGVVAGLASVGTAIVLLVTEHKPAKPATGARVPWIAADVLTVGPAGAMLGAHGSF